ncbi:hypothetical protein RHMOL_Rhmol12G0205600 [Rhododendron molle]|uniref:Uncharacterized protein n=1 Tax=Rhododendron molle TaxID=49168 RepID=A0ACC0LKN0_RHOML|nr:hypothetical protein RHMOL_Rhmol12G0205600 [Rhododendron molle]
MRFILKGLLSTSPVASTRAYGLSFSTSSLKPTLDCSNSTCPQSPTVSYLVNSCGLSLESAISASKNLQIGTTDQPDSVLTLLKSIGLGKSHIRNLIIKRPVILLADANKTLKPNVEVFGSLGIFGTNLLKLLTKAPRFLEVDAHSTVEFFSAYGFTKEQICMLTMKRPQLYLYNAPRNFKPKMEYIKSLGFSDAEVVQILLDVPNVIRRSLENKIIPSFQVIKRIVGTGENVLKAIKASYRVCDKDLEKVLEPNIAILINHGVPKPLLLKFFMSQTRSLVLNTHQFTEVVEEVDKLGFDPTSMLYLLAVNSLAMINKSLWERKSEVYRSFGMSEDQILSAFIRQPMSMMTSEKKIRKLMGFFVNELKISPLVISKTPKLMLLSLEKRLVPRCSVLQLLMSKGAIKGDFSLVHALRMNHKKFEEKYVSKYQNVIPKVVEAHQGKIPFQGESHIRNLIIKRPVILLADANKTLKPNVEVFGSLGISGTDLLKLLTKDPRFLEVDAHSTVEFFSAYGFTKEQICMLTMKHPQLYWYNAPRNFKPKMEYFKSLGFSDAEIVQILLYVPYVLGRSLENTIIPSVQFIKRIVGTDENVLKAIKASYRIFDLGKVHEPNIAVLINHGVPKPLVLKFITSRSRSLVLNTHRFTEVVEEVDKLGFDPTSMLYLLAVNSLATINKSLWERKSGVYRSFGMSEDQILSAFIRQPMFMLTSEKKIRKLMGFFVNELKISPLVISKTPKLMLLSLEKRLVPRCSVLQLLMSKGAIKGDFSLVHALEMTHKKFEERYVSEYQNVIPEVVEACQGKIPFQGFPISA